MEALAATMADLKAQMDRIEAKLDALTGAKPETAKPTTDKPKK